MLTNIPPNQRDNYSYAYDILMDRFSISEKHRGELQDMLYYFLLNFESENNIIYAHEQSLSALKFFRECIEVKTVTINEFKRKRSNMPNTYDPLTEYLTVQIHGKFQKAKATLDYYGIALEMINFLYDKLKATDHLLNGYLRDYKEIPSAQTLDNLIEEVKLKVQFEFLEDIRVVANNLNEYLKTNLAELVSHHRYHLIFELLYLCDVFKYIGKINRKPGTYYSIANNPNKDNKYLPLTRVTDGDRYKVVNGIFKNEDRSEAYKKKVMQKLKEK